ncbi:E3 ubiquitin-protein ligase Topors-like [Diachasmimorpha longicaudata]|uniref:E3 ubiquitin-protein ligase Topors-like n=1 Tax=Diachasmimorpha longicaudata TaxID=58733 RepID=UPI0030B901B5
MEEPIPLEEVPETKEPVKLEPTSSASPGDRGGASSPTPECSICLGHLVNTSFTDSCLHQFCFTCLLQWSKIKTECPLCKQTFKSIIHNVRSEEDYDQYHVPREMVGPPQVSPLVDINLELINLDYEFIRHVQQDPAARRFAYRTTMTPNRRLRFLPVSGPGVPTVPREELRHRRRNPVDYRRNVYRHGEWSTPLHGHYSGALERSVEFFRLNPYELNRLIPWINRDLQILLNGNEPHIAYVLRTIMDSLTRYDIRSAELRDVLRPHFGIHTDHFLHELMNYARTGYDMATYDNYITYHGLPTGYINSVQSPARSETSSSWSSDDSDVRVVDNMNVGPAEVPAVGPHPIDMPGPSTVGQAFQSRIPTGSPTIFTISSNSDESDCEIVGYIKPRHERTPEIIEISSSDGEIAGPSTSGTMDQTPRTPSPAPAPLDEPSTSQETSRRNPRGARRKASMHLAPMDCSFSDFSSESKSQDWGKKGRKTKRTRKTSKACKKSPRKQSQRESLNSKKRNRDMSSSNDEEAHQELQQKKNKRFQKFRLRATSLSCNEDDEEGPHTPKKSLVIKIRKDLMNQNQHDRHTKDLSSSSEYSSSSSSSSDSDSSASSDTNLPLKKRKWGRTHRRTDKSSDKGKRSKGKIKSTVVKCAPVSTILRKDATKKEWYVDKKVSRSTSRSSDEEQPDTRLRLTPCECRDRNGVEEFSSAESPSDDEGRSNSQCSSRAERTQDKYRSRHKCKRKEKERDGEEPSTSAEKHSVEGRSMKKRKKTHKKYKSSKGKHSKGRKRDKRHWGSSDSYSSLD